MVIRPSGRDGQAAKFQPPRLSQLVAKLVPLPDADAVASLELAGKNLGSSLEPLHHSPQRGIEGEPLRTANNGGMTKCYPTGNDVGANAITQVCV